MNFPHVLKDGKVIVDEMCTCGHLITNHGHEQIELPDQTILVEGHGGCLCCNCQQYTWESWVIEEKKG